MILKVDTAVVVPVNLMPLVDDTDFKTRETAIAYNAAGMDLVWNFVTTAGVCSQTAVTPTTGGVYDWTHLGDAIYTMEIPASGGASINNDTEGYGWFSGVATGVLPWRGPVITFAPAHVVDGLVAGTDKLQVDGAEFGGQTVTASAGVTVGAYVGQTGAVLDGTGGKMLLQASQPGVTIPTVTSVTNAPPDSSGITSLLARLTATRAGYLDQLEHIHDDTNSTYNAVTSGTFGNAALKTLIDALTTDLAKVPKSDGTVTFNSTALASVNAEVAAALVAIHLDHLLAADYDPVSKPGVATALLNELVESDSGVSRFTANALEQGPAGTLTAADVADAVWNEAQLEHTTAGTFGKYLDAQVSTVGGGTLTAADIADAVWDEVLNTAHEVSGSASVLVQNQENIPAIIKTYGLAAISAGLTAREPMGVYGWDGAQAVSVTFDGTITGDATITLAAASQYYSGDLPILAVNQTLGVLDLYEGNIRWTKNGGWTSADWDPYLTVAVSVGATGAVTEGTVTISVYLAGAASPTTFTFRIESIPHGQGDMPYGLVFGGQAWWAMSASDWAYQPMAAYYNTDAANIRDALGMASANLDTQLSDIATKTDNLPASPAAVGDAMTLTADYDAAKTAATQSSVDALQGDVTVVDGTLNELLAMLLWGGTFDPGTMTVVRTAGAFAGTVQFYGENDFLWHEDVLLGTWAEVGGLVIEPGWTTTAFKSVTVKTSVPVSEEFALRVYPRGSNYISDSAPMTLQFPKGFKVAQVKSDGSFVVIHPTQETYGFGHAFLDKSGYELTSAYDAAKVAASQTSVDGKPTLVQIEASSTLAKQAKLLEIENIVKDYPTTVTHTAEKLLNTVTWASGRVWTYHWNIDQTLHHISVT